jgi:phosphatidylinositol-3-phosphatase
MKRVITIGSLVLGACGGGNGMPMGNPDAKQTSDGNHSGSDGSVLDPDGSMPMGNATIFTIVLENHDYAEIVGSSNAPYINSLIASYGLATNYKDTNHPSLPNYLHMISGDDQYPGFIDIDPTTVPFFPANQPNLGTQLEAANIKWRSYQESMGSPCALSGSGSYAPKHDPFLYFTDMQASPLCADRNVDFGSFAADLATNTFRYMWITPNLTDDGHDPSTDPVAALKTSDDWMAQHVPAILASDGFKNGGVLFVTWDEAEGRNGDDADKIPMIVISTKIKTPGMTSNTAFTHSSYAATVEDLLGLPRLDKVKTAASLMEFLQ